MKQTLAALPTSIAYDDIKEKRARKQVPCGPQGRVADYVPFYFAPRSPMLYTISRGNIPGRNESDIIYLVSSVELTLERGLSCTFTDGHPIMAFTTFYDNIDDLKEVDWNLMESRYWHDIDTDPDRKRRRQAEFLVHNFFPFDLVGKIAVRNESMLELVESYISGQTGQPKLAVERGWYYG